MSNTNLKNLLDLVETTLDGNVDINAWCMTNFNKIPTVFIGLNPGNPPPFDGNVPMIVVGTGTRHREPNQAHRAHQIRIGCAIQSDTQIRSASQQVVRFKGLQLIDDFTNLVEKKITTALNANGFPSIQEPEVEDEIAGNNFKTIVTFTVRCASRLKETSTP